MQKAVVLLPAYNEKENLKTLIPAIFDEQKNISGWDLHILVIDDNSPDGTVGEIQTMQKELKKLHLITGQKKGLGDAYRRAFKYVLDTMSADIVFEMDADWQHPPTLLPLFIKNIDSGSDFVIGSRYISGGSIPSNWELHRKFFSYVGNLVLQLGFMRFSIRDWTSGYRAIRTSFLKKTLTDYEGFDGYTIQIALLDNAIKNKLKISEVPLQFRDRRIGESKINTFDFVFRNLLFIAQYSTFFKFAVVGVIGAIVDFGISFIGLHFTTAAVWFVTVISAECAMISNFILNNSWSFSHKKIDSSKKGHLVTAFGRFQLLSIGSIAIQAILMGLATFFFPKKFWYIYKVIIIAFCIIPYSYILYNKVIWKDK